MQRKATELGVPEGAMAGPNNGTAFFVQGVSAGMQALERLVADIAPTDIPVLLVGESGTGKEVMALHIHGLSRRWEEQFLKMSCATLTPESFSGWVNGSGDERGNSGSGTLFLDEISALDAACQPKLLHALPDGDGLRHGRCLAARVISATSRNLEEEMRAGRFREELYYRINGVCLRLPPLRQRKEDVPALVEFFLAKYAALLGRPQPSVTAQTLRILLDYSWPGNIRELENAVRNIVALGEERVAADLGSSPAEARIPVASSEAVSLKEAARAASRQAERELILKVLARTRWNRKRAAQELRISYKALLYKLKQIGLDDAATS